MPFRGPPETTNVSVHNRENCRQAGNRPVESAILER